MSKRKEYALEPLHRLRERQVDAAARALAEAAAARSAAEERRVQQERRVVRADAEAKVERVALRLALDRGELTAEDLAHATAWRARATAERARLQRQLRSAEQQQQEAVAREEESRAELGARRGDAKVIEKHRSAWMATVRKAQEASEEEAASEIWRPRR
jgi:hypothetical protein